MTEQQLATRLTTGAAQQVIEYTSSLFKRLEKDTPQRARIINGIDKQCYFHHINLSICFILPHLQDHKLPGNL